MIRENSPNGILSADARTSLKNVNKTRALNPPTLMAFTQLHCLWTNSHNKATPGSGAQTHPAISIMAL